MNDRKIRVAVVGATGYTGAELLRLLVEHPRVEVTAICGQSKAGQSIASVLPSFAGVLAGDVEPFEPARLRGCADVAFCALPHGASAAAVAALRAEGLVVFDLSADFRLSDRETFRRWYGEHQAPDLFGKGVYGLVELHRDAIRAADIVAVPGCYATAAIVALAPLLAGGLVARDGIVIDAKSGVSGGGRGPAAAFHFPETAEGIRAYKVGTHRHTSEIEQELGLVAGAEVSVLFAPHLVPMTRGILATCYATPSRDDVTADACTAAARKLYEGSPSIVVRESGVHPDTLWVRGSNRVQVSYLRDAHTGRIVAQAVIDNLLKGAGGQAVQAFNVRFGLPEGLGLGALAPWP